MSGIDMKRSQEISRKRILYAIPGFVLGFGIALLVRRFLEPQLFFTEFFMIGLAGAVLTMRFGEKFRALPSAKGIEIMRMREEMAPTDFKTGHAIPKALRTETEKKIQL